MRSVYIRPLNFLYGKDASQHIQKKIAAPICGNKSMAFTKIEIIYKDSKNSQLVDVSKISKLNYKNKDQVLGDFSNIKKKKTIFLIWMLISQ